MRLQAKHNPASRRIIFFIIILLISIAAVIFNSFNCKSSLNNSDENNNTSLIGSITQFIRADSGGVLKDPANGLKFEISPHALPVDTLITVKTLNVSDATLYDATVHFSPEYLLMCAPCTVFVPLGKTYDGPSSLEIWDFNGEDPSMSLPSGRYAQVVSNSDGYFAEAEVIHFSGMSFSRVCHSGTIRRVLEDFETRGTNRDEIFNNVNNKYADVNLSNNNVETAGPAQVQALLDTYFDDVGGWQGGNDVPDEIISQLTQYVKSGRMVVIAFGPSVIGPRSGNNKFYDCAIDKYRHTAVLQESADGKVQIVNTVSVSNSMRSKLNMQEIVIDYPLSDINRFREEKQGVLLELELCGSIGCLSDNTYNPWHISPFNPAEGGVYWLEWGKKSWSERLLAIYDRLIKENPDYYPPRPVPWRDVRIYVMRGSGPSVVTNDTAWAVISIEGLYSKTIAPGFCAGTLSQITDGETVKVAGCPSVVLTNGDKPDGMTYDILTFIFNPEIPGPGTYSVSTSDIVDGGYENIMFTTPVIMNYMPLINGPVFFTEKSGTIILESIGKQIGDRIVGSFNLKIQGKHKIDAANEEIINGTVKGEFNVVIKNYSEIPH